MSGKTTTNPAIQLIMTVGKSKQQKPSRKYKIHIGYGDDGDNDNKAGVKGKQW